MLNIESVLKLTHKGIIDQNPRYVVTGDEHVLDTKTGITLHVYDNWFKFTHADENIIVKEDFTLPEQTLIWEIKKAITPIDVLKDRDANYKPLQIARREKFSALHEQPTSVDVNVPVAEENTDIYMG